MQKTIQLLKECTILYVENDKKISQTVLELYNALFKKTYHFDNAKDALMENKIQNPENSQNPFLFNCSNGDPSKSLGRVFIHAKNKKKTTIERTTGNTRNRSSPSVIKINSKMHLMPKPNNTTSAFRSPVA